MTFNLLLDSNLARRQYGIGEKQKTHDFTINFHPPIWLEKTKTYKAALKKLITMSYSWYNIAEAYKNNKLKWRNSSEDWQTLAFPDGIYDYEGIERFFAVSDGGCGPECCKKSTFSVCILTSISTALLSIWPEIMSLISLTESLPV